MTRTIDLTKEQKDLFESSFKAAADSANKAQEAIDLAGLKRKNFEDLVVMYCLSSGLLKEKVKIDPQTWTVLYEEEEKTLKL